MNSKGTHDICSFKRRISLFYRYFMVQFKKITYNKKENPGKTLH